MTAEYTYTDVDGDVLHVRSFPADPGLSVTIKNGEYGRATVEIAAADVRKVAAAMHEKAGLPDRWTGLRDDLARRLDLCETMARTHGDAEARNLAAERCSVYRATLRRMDEMEAGQ